MTKKYEGNDEDGYATEDLREMFDWKTAPNEFEALEDFEVNNLIAESLGMEQIDGKWFYKY